MTAGLVVVKESITLQLQVFEISQFEPSSSCADLYFQKQVYFNGNFIVSIGG